MVNLETINWNGAAWDNLEVYGFARCKITGAAIPEGFKSIGGYAFSDNHLMTTASIPSTVTSLQEMAFCNCENLVTVSYNGTTAEWNALSKKPSWQGCTSLTAITCTDGSVPVVR